MSEILKNAGLDKALSDKINIFRTNPAAMMQLLLMEFENVVDKDIANIDPTNPFIASLEASVVTASSVITDHTKSLRGLYALLAEDNNDLYRHMSDKDYMDRFSTYAKTDLTFVLLRSDIKNKGVYNEDENCYQLTLPRYTLVTVSNTPLLLLYPVDIKECSNELIKISTDTSIIHNIASPEYDIVKYAINRDTNGNEWVYFNLPFVQLDVKSSEHTLVSNVNTDINIEYNDNFYYAEAYIKNVSTDNKWNRVYSTHSDIVYDYTKPTVKFTIENNNSLNVSIPPVYLHNNLISGILRIDVYTTKGAISLELPEFEMDSFTRTVRKVDASVDSNAYTGAINSATLNIYGSTRLEGGRTGLSFKDIRTNVINNTTGRIEAPVSYNEVKAMVLSQDYGVYKGFYSINGHIYLMATKRLNSRTFSAIKNEVIPTLGMVSITHLELRTNDNVIDNGDSLTIKSNTVFSNDNDVLSIVQQSEVDNINNTSAGARISKINDLNSWYTPFYHVLETDNDSLDHRVYHLDNPLINLLTFKDDNETGGVEVNTGSVTITKKTTGYNINISTISRDGYKDLDNSTHNLQLTVDIYGIKYFITATRSESTTTDGELIFDIFLETNYHINKNNEITITNMVDINGIQRPISIPLTTDFNLYYLTSSPNIPHELSKLDTEVNINNLDSNSIVLTKESINVTLGQYLKYMVSYSNMNYSKVVYKKYAENVPAVYSKDIYQSNPANGSIFFIDPVTCDVTKNKLHSKGEIIIGGNGTIVYKHYAGDTIIGDDGNPIIDKDSSLQYNLIMFLLEGEYLFANGEDYVGYRKYIADTIAQRCITDIDDYNSKLLEQTSLYYSAYKTHGIIHTTSGVIESRLPINIIFHINSGFSDNSEILNLIKSTTTEIITDMITNSYIAIDEIRTILRDRLGDITQTIQIENLGNSETGGIINITEEGERIGLKKITYITRDGTLAVKPDINYIFKYV